MNIAVFGGSFDPPHIGHEQIVLNSLKQLPIDKLFIVPTFLNPFKTAYFLDASTRLGLIKELFEDIKKVQICDFEVQQKEKTSTFQTINYLKNTYKIDKIYLIIGADNLKSLHLWYNFEKLKKIVNFVVVTRDKLSLHSSCVDLHIIKLQLDISSTNIRQTKDLSYIPTKIKQKVKQIWKIE
jgi:nicotinate-nucleotide adenylyltransferase